MADKGAECTKKIDEFVKVTGVISSRAAFYLESAGWDYNLAISSYFERNEEDEGSQDSKDSYSSAASVPSPAPRPQASTSGPIGPPPDRVVTLSNFKNAESDSEESDEGLQAFYAGGSARSGQQVLGPRPNNKNRNLVAELFKAAKDHGAEVVDQSKDKVSTAHLRAFRGTGYVLGAELDEQSEVVNAEASPPPPLPSLPVILRFWRTGFSIDDGPLREYTDPENQEFLTSVRKGEIPRELIRKSGGTREIDLDIEDHSHEDYVAPKRKMMAFAGEGHRLGSPTPQTSPMCLHGTIEKNKEEADKQLQVDESQPTTTIQIRLSDGSRIALRLNHTHTVNDIRQYIVTSHPEYGASIFSLMTAFPPKEITDNDVSVKDANLLNSVIVQKLQ